MVPPNIMLTADNSGSMAFDYAPETLFDSKSACWTMTVISTCDIPLGKAAGAFFEYTEHDKNPPMKAAAFNRMAYNPLHTYLPRKKADGTDDVNYNSAALWQNMDTSRDVGDVGIQTVNLIDSTTLNYHAQAAPPVPTDQYVGQAINTLKNRYLGGTTSPASTFLAKYTVGGAYLNLPPFYFMTSVKWCNRTRATGDADPGSPMFSNCQDEQTSIYQHPYFYPPLGDYTGRTSNTAYPPFDLIVLDFKEGKIYGPANNYGGGTSYTFDYYDPSSGTIASFTRTFNEEATNYANWWVYYRIRMAAAKTVTSLVFNDISNTNNAADTKTPRVGYSAINDRNPMLKPAAAFTGAARTAFFNKLLDTKANGDTPLRTALYNVGEMYKDKDVIPSNMACMRNYSILFTDGQWNDSNFPATGNSITEDSVLADNLPQPVTVYGKTIALKNEGLPRPILDIAPTHDTLADIAFRYWRMNLRPDLDPTGKTVTAINNDPATWPHMNFYGMGFGVKGTLPSSDQDATLAKITSGALNWPVPVADQATTVDDLWHASVNGFGGYYSASSPDEFRRALKSILNAVLNVGGVRAASGYTSRNMMADGGISNYAVSFSPGWNGDVVLQKMLDTGLVDATTPSVFAADKLQTLLTPSGTSVPWRDSRYIFTRIAGEHSPTSNAVPFQFSKLTSTQLGYLGGANATIQQKMIAYLRGDRTNEGAAAGKFRIRGKGPLGDIVDASPVVVGNPSWNYVDDGYKEFATANQSRGTMVYVAANDGMLHAFDADLNERWAYLPMALLRDPADGGIAALSYQEDDFNNPFKHLFYVNATPRSMDVKIGDTWKTILVGGLGKGGKSYYALDITSSAAVTNEATAAPVKSLWEFTDPNMGYTFGRPILTKTNAWSTEGGETKWVAILPSGYNNASGKACLFFVDLETGLKLTDLCTTEGTASDPLGMVAIGGYVKNVNNQLTPWVYGGDQKGNLWRFDLTDSDPKNWSVKKMALLRDASSKPQYVTTEPWPQDSKNAEKRFVLVGTGGFRNDADLIAVTPGNTFYSIYDDPDATAPTTRSNWLQVTGLDGVSIDKGWYEDMDTGYHVNLNPQSAYYIAAWAVNKFNGNAPGRVTSDLCTAGAFDGRFYARTVDFGKPVLGESTAGIGDGTLRYYSVPSGIAGFTFALVNGDDGKGGKQQRLTAIIDDTLGKKFVLPKGMDFGKPPAGSGSTSTFKRLNIRFIDH